MCISPDDYYIACNQHRFCTCADNRQYTRAFNMIREGCSLRDLALVTWMLSDETYSFAQVLEILGRYERQN